MSDKAVTAAGPRPSYERWAVLGIWLLVSAVMVWLCSKNIAERNFPDPDDVMRLMQVRDWLGGQSWFDVSQYRLNPPAGVPMHWSRLVDVPIATVVLATRPFVGQHSAENVALAIVPLLTLGAAMWLVHRIAMRLMDARTALLAVVALPVSLGALQQLRPMRIDHHGWQIVLALVGVLAALDDQRPRRAGMIAGVAMAAWLNISIEGLPFTAVVGALFGFNWLIAPVAADRLKAFAVALAGTSLLLFGLTHYPSTWLNQPHDVVTVAHLTGFTVVAALCLAFVREDIADVRLRAAVLAGVGILALAAMFAVDPHWMQDPFAAVDPLVRKTWLNGVDEGQPMWKLHWRQVAVALSEPLVGMAGALLAVRVSFGPMRNRALSYLYLLFASAFASVFVFRWAGTASIISLPGAAFLCQFVLRRARTVSLAPVRILATSGALCTIAPAYAVPLSVPDSQPKVSNAMDSFELCRRGSETAKLASLPVGLIAAPLDLTPDLLVNTRHLGIASGHHRGSAAMAEAIRLFIFTPDQSRQVAARRHVDYVVVCPGAAEIVRYANYRPKSLAAMLNKGAGPEWLEPIRVPGLRALRVWRVRKG